VCCMQVSESDMQHVYFIMRNTTTCTIDYTRRVCVKGHVSSSNLGNNLNDVMKD